MIEHQLAEFFWADDDINNRTGERIYPMRAPQGVRGELIILQEITNTPAYTLQREAGVHDKIVQIDCYAATPRAAESLAELVRMRLSGFRGEIGTTTPVDVESCRIISSGPETERPRDDSDNWIHRYRMDFAMWVQATIPTFS